MENKEVNFDKEFAGQIAYEYGKWSRRRFFKNTGNSVGRFFANRYLKYDPDVTETPAQTIAEVSRIIAAISAIRLNDKVIEVSMDDPIAFNLISLIPEYEFDNETNVVRFPQTRTEEEFDKFCIYWRTLTFVYLSITYSMVSILGIYAKENGPGIFIPSRKLTPGLWCMAGLEIRDDYSVCQIMADKLISLRFENNTAIATLQNKDERVVLMKSDHYDIPYPADAFLLFSDQIYRGINDYSDNNYSLPLYR